MMPDPQPLVIVLCGGTSRRLGARDKTRELLGGTTVLDHLLDDLPSQWQVICVGEKRVTHRSVRWCRESPPGGGPVAGIAAGLDHFGPVEGTGHGQIAQPGDVEPIAQPGDVEPISEAVHVEQTIHLEHRSAEIRGAEICAVVAGDMPFAGSAVATLVAALGAQPGLDAVLASDPDGRTQPLLAAYRRNALTAALPREPAGARLMSVVNGLLVDTVPCDARTTLDVDTPEALERARHIVEA